MTSLLRLFWIGTILTGVSLFPATMSVFAQKGSKPTFTQYEMPETATPLPVISDWLVDRNYWMLGIGLTLLITSTIAAIRWRSRRMILLNAILAIATLGFAFGGCPCPIGAIQNVTVSLTNPQYLLPWTIAVLFLAPLFMTLLFGRTFCASACPIGALQELIAVRPIIIPRSVDDLLGMFRFIFLGAVVLWATMGLPFLACRFDPAIALFRGGTGWGIFLIWSIAILLLGIVIARPYCRWLCPYGAILQICGRLAIWRVRVAPGDCSRCRLCETICPYNAIIPPSQPPTFTERRIGVAKFSRAIIVFPLFLSVFGFGGWLLSFPLSQSHPIVKQAELVHAEETGLVDYLGAFDETLAHYRSQEENEALYRRAAVIAGRFQWATALFGIWVGAVLGGTFVAASTRRKYREYHADPGKCFACGRCFWYCPNQKQDRYFLEQP